MNAVVWWWLKENRPCRLQRSSLDLYPADHQYGLTQWPLPDPVEPQASTFINKPMVESHTPAEEVQPRSGRTVPNCLDCSTASSFVTLWWWWRHGTGDQNRRGSFVFLNSWTFHLIYRLPLLAFFGAGVYFSVKSRLWTAWCHFNEKVLGKMSAWGFSA